MFHNHPSPPTAIISDMFLGFTHHLACQLGIRRYVFSPSGAFALSVIYSLWRDMPKRIKGTSDDDDDDKIFHFPNIPNHPRYPWWQISPIYRSYIEGDPELEFIREGLLADISSYGLVINTFTELEYVYLDHLMKDLGHNRVWSVGPVLPQDDDDDDSFVPSERGGSSSVLASEVLSWLDTYDNNSVVYICFGSQADGRVSNGLEKSGVKFIWSTKGHVSTVYGKIPFGFEDQVAGRGMVIREWAPQVLTLRHRAVGAFLTHCGWNSILEGLLAGVTMLAWPMRADQFVNANLLVDELKVASRVCERAKTIPKSEELAGFLAEAVGLEGKGVEWKARVSEFRKAALNGIKGGGSSIKNWKGSLSI